MRKQLIAVAVATVASLSAVSGAVAQSKAAGGVVDDGEAVFKKCSACHRVGPDAKNLIGPNLTGVIGRQAGTAADYPYSELNKATGASGLVWTEDLIFEYLEEPTAFLKKFLTDKGKADLANGATKMVFKLADEQDRKDVIAYLKTFSK
jgi:cytochrome c